MRVGIDLGEVRERFPAVLSPPQSFDGRLSGLDVLPCLERTRNGSPKQALAVTSATHRVTLPSLPVIIGKGQSGIVKGVPRPESGLISVSWDPQFWEQRTWASTWGIPGFYTKRYVKLGPFDATINSDWIEVAQSRD